MEHYVMLKLHDEQNKSEFVQNARSILEELVDEIDGLLEVSVYENIIDRPDNCDVMIHIVLDSKDTLYRYIKHPIHERFIAYAKPLVATKVSFDR